MTPRFMLGALITNRWKASAWQGWASSVVLHVTMATLVGYSASPLRQPIEIGARQHSSVRIVWQNEASNVSVDAAMVEMPKSTQVIAQPTVPVEVRPTTARIADRRFQAEPTVPVSEPRWEVDVERDVLTARLPERSTATKDELSTVPDLEEAVKRPAPAQGQSRRPMQIPPALAQAVTEPAANRPSVEETVHEEGGRLVSPDFSNNPPPVYPTSAVAKRWAGTVMLLVHVNDRGRVERVELLRSSGHAILDGAAANAVKRWTAKPAHRNGRSVPTAVRIPVRFQLPN